MQIWGEQQFQAPREQVWELMNRPDILQACLPGCEAVDLVAPDEYAIRWSIGVSLLRGTFAGTITLSDKVEPERVNLSLNVSSSQGVLSGVITITFTDDPQTLAAFVGSANMTGAVARIGARLVQPTVRKLVEQFMACLATKVVPGQILEPRGFPIVPPAGG
jgi:carbon monoxide dehydrogenase subunit G